VELGTRAVPISSAGTGEVWDGVVVPRAAGCRRGVARVMVPHNRCWMQLKMLKSKFRRLQVPKCHGCHPHHRLHYSILVFHLIFPAKETT